MAARCLDTLGADAGKIRTQVIRMVGESQEAVAAGGAGGAPGSNKTPTLEEYGTNLTEQAVSVSTFHRHPPPPPPSLFSMIPFLPHIPSIKITWEHSTNLVVQAGPFYFSQAPTPPPSNHIHTRYISHSQRHGRCTFTSIKIHFPEEDSWKLAALTEMPCPS